MRGACSDVLYRPYPSVRMFASDFRLTLRQIRKQPLYTFINIGGLALGMACFLILGLFVYHELSYDRFHEKADRIARLTFSVEGFGAIAVMPAISLPKVVDTYPEVQYGIRFYHQPFTFRHKQTLLQEEKAFFADAEVFSVFSFPLLSGDPSTALSEPNSVVLTEKTADRYFGSINPIGQTLERNDGEVFTVTGVVASPPTNSHIKFDLLASFTTLMQDEAKYNYAFGHQSYTYLLLDDPSSMKALENKLNERISGDQEATKEFIGFSLQDMVLSVMPLADVHFHGAPGGLEPTGDIRYLWLFGGIALFILLLAAINYMNLATARYTQRQREVGVRKALGAHRGQLAFQFLGESVVTSLISAVFAFALLEIGIPYVETVFGFAFPLTSDVRLVFLGVLLTLSLLVGILAGSYPALFLSRFQPASIFQGGGQQRGGLRMRQVLVTTQFAVSIALIFGTLVLQRQLHYIQTKPLGYDTEQIAQLTIPNKQAPSFKEALKAIPGVESASVSSGVPIAGMIYYHDDEDKEGDETLVRSFRVDADYLQTLGIQLVAGRFFDPNRATDSTALVVNESWVRMIAQAESPEAYLTDPQNAEGDLIPIGVISDFHSMSLRDAIIPTTLTFKPTQPSNIVLRFNMAAFDATFASISELWTSYFPDEPFDYTLLNDLVANQYKAERRLGQLFTLFTTLALIIAALGLFGLAAFTAERRTKEIGVRKVLGASVPGLVFLLSKEFTRLVMIAGVLALPLAYAGMHGWLQEFAYSIDLHVGFVLFALAMTLILALATVSYQAIKAARANPVDALRYE